MCPLPTSVWWPTCADGRSLGSERPPHHLAGLQKNDKGSIGGEHHTSNSADDDDISIMSLSDDNEEEEVSQASR